MPTPLAKRPLTHQFWFELDGFNDTLWKSVSGIESSLEVVEDEGTNAKAKFRDRLPGELTYGDLSLTRGFVTKEVYDWFVDFNINGNSLDENRKSGSVVVYDTTQTEFARWNFEGLWPVSIGSSDVSSQSSELMVESLTLAYHRMERVK